MDQRAFAKSLRQNMTDAEHLLWRHLRARRFEGQKFRRQQPIGAYVVEFVHFRARVIVDADGGQHVEAPPSMAASGPWCGRLTGIASEWSPQFPGYVAGAVEAASLAEW